MIDGCVHLAHILNRLQPWPIERRFSLAIFLRKKLILLIIDALSVDALPFHLISKLFDRIWILYGLIEKVVDLSPLLALVHLVILLKIKWYSWRRSSCSVLCCQ